MVVTFRKQESGLDVEVVGQISSSWNISQIGVAFIQTVVGIIKKMYPKASPKELGALLANYWYIILSDGLEAIQNEAIIGMSECDSKEYRSEFKKCLEIIFQKLADMDEILHSQIKTIN